MAKYCYHGKVCCGSTGGLPDSQGDDRDNVGGDYSRLILTHKVDYYIVAKHIVKNRRIQVITDILKIDLVTCDRVNAL